MEQYNIFSKEIEEQIASTVITIVNSTAVDAINKGDRRYYKKKAFCAQMQISHNTLQGWIANGLPCIQVEGISLIDMRDAEIFLQAHKI